MLPFDYTRIRSTASSQENTQQLQRDQLISQGCFGEIWSTTKSKSNIDHSTSTFEMAEYKFPTQPIVIKYLKDITPGNFNEEIIHAQKEVNFLREVHRDWSENVFLLYHALSSTIAITMPFQAGNTLETICQTKALTFTGFCHLALKIIDALAAIHQLSIVHLDLKPANIIATGENSLFEQVRFIDLGSAQKINDRIFPRVVDPNNNDFSHISSDRKVIPGTPRNAILVQPRLDLFSMSVTLLMLFKSTLTDNSDLNFNVLIKLNEAINHYDHPFYTDEKVILSLKNFFQDPKAPKHQALNNQADEDADDDAHEDQFACEL